MSQGLEEEKTKGKYKVIIASITAVTAITTSIIGAALGAKYAPVEVNVNLDGYISRTQDEIASQQTSDDGKASNDLQDKITILQKDKEDLQQRIIALERENDGLLNTIETQNEQISTLEQEKMDLLNKISEIESENLSSSLSPDSPKVDSNQISKGTVKLTSLTILGNNASSYNYVYNSSEDRSDARSNLGEVFDSSISMRHRGYIDFYLNCSYQTLNATISISESTKNIDLHTSTLTIYNATGYGDDEKLDLLYESPALAMGFIPTEIGPINVSGVERLRIKFDSNGSTSYVPRIVIGNPELVPI